MLAIERLAAQRVAIDRSAFIVAQAWFVVREEDLPDEVSSAADTGLVKDAGEVLLHGVRREVQFVSTIEPLRAMDPAVILSTHLPPAVGQTSKFLDMLAAAPHVDPSVGPDQHALEELLAGFEPATTAG